MTLPPARVISNRDGAAGTLAALQAARSAMEAERAAGGADAYQAG